METYVFKLFISVTKHGNVKDNEIKESVNDLISNLASYHDNFSLRTENVDFFNNKTSNLKKLIKNETNILIKNSINEFLEDLEFLIMNEEDDFDRGKGKYILKKWIELKRKENETF